VSCIIYVSNALQLYWCKLAKAYFDETATRVSRIFCFPWTHEFYFWRFSSCVSTARKQQSSCRQSTVSVFKIEQGLRHAVPISSIDEYCIRTSSGKFTTMRRKENLVLRACFTHRACCYDIWRMWYPTEYRLNTGQLNFSTWVTEMGQCSCSLWMEAQPPRRLRLA
jgi:hypothetical protein